MENNRRVDFTEILPAEVLFQICFNLNRLELSRCANVSKKLKPVCMYVLEHKRKIRLVDDILNVIFVSLPMSGKTMIVDSLAHRKNCRNPTPGTERTWYHRGLVNTKSLRGYSQAMAFIDAPNGHRYRKLNWIYASQSDVCVFVINAWQPDAEEKWDKELIQELILGVTHMMSSREVIIAVNIQDEVFKSSTPESRFRQVENKIRSIFTKAIGPCFDIIPVDGLKNKGILSEDPIPWFKGPTLWDLLAENQKRTNYNELAVEKLRQEPFELQIVQKFFIRGISGGVAIGRVLSGSISVDTENKTQVRLIPHRESNVATIELGYETRKTAMAGDYVGLNLKGATIKEMRKRYGFIWTYTDPLFNHQTRPIDIALAFRMQFVVVNSSLFVPHNIYIVHYGAHRIHCALLWIIPSNTDKTSAKDPKKSKQAIMVPLERVPMRVYKPTAFQKNIHGKVMLTQRHGAIAAIGRIDKVLSKKMNVVTMPNAPQDYIQLYNNVMNGAKELFSRYEKNLLAEFLDHMKNSSSARNSVAGFKKQFRDVAHFDRNE